MPVRDALAGVRARAGRAPPEALLLEAWMSGFAQLHVRGADAASAPGPRPRASRVARWQVAQREAVTNLRHETIRWSIRSRAACSRCATASATGARSRRRWRRGRDPGDPALLAQLDDALGTLAQCGLLERDEPRRD